MKYNQTKEVIQKSMSKTTEIIEKCLLSTRKDNVKHCMLNPSDYLEKIKLYNERFDGMWTDEEIIEQIKKNDIVASIFSKDPAKQNLTEDIVANIIKSNKHVKDFQVLSKGGKNSIRLNNKGEFVYGKCSMKDTKSVDYVFTYKTDKFYATQKFTRGKGGSQDNQCRDVIDFLKHGSLRNKEQFMAVLDGDYYTEEKMKELKEIFKDKKNIHINSADIFLEG